MDTNHQTADYPVTLAIATSNDIKIPIWRNETVQICTASSYSLYNQARAFGCNETEALHYLNIFLKKIPELTALYTPGTIQFSTFLRNQLRIFLLKQHRSECPGANMDMKRIINALPFPFNEVVQLTYYDNWSVEQLAAFMRCPQHSAARLKRQSYRLTSYAMQALKNEQDMDRYYFSLYSTSQKQFTIDYYKIRYDFDLRAIEQHREDLEIPLQTTFLTLAATLSTITDHQDVLPRLITIFNAQL